MPVRFVIPLLSLHCSVCKAKSQVVNDLTAAVDYAFSCCKGRISPLQNPDELLSFLKIVKERKPRYVLEIGTARGGTLFLLCQVATSDAVVVSVDLPGGPFGGGYPIWRIPTYKRFALAGQRIHLVRNDSHRDETFREVASILGSNQLDLLFIDGDHSSKGVERDFEMYSPLVRTGGLIAFHDIRTLEPERGGGVCRYWQQLKSTYDERRVLEIIADHDQHLFGIGLIEK